MPDTKGLVQKNLTDRAWEVCKGEGIIAKICPYSSKASPLVESGSEAAEITCKLTVRHHIMFSGLLKSENIQL